MSVAGGTTPRPPTAHGHARTPEHAHARCSIAQSLDCSTAQPARRLSPVRGHTTPQFKKVVKKVVASGARVIYMGTKPEPDTTSIHSDYEKYDAKIRALAVEYATGTLAPTPSPTVAAGSGTPSATPAVLTMVDVYPSFNAMGNPDSLYGDDNLHMSSEGVRVRVFACLRVCVFACLRP